MTPPNNGLKTALEATLGTCLVCQRYTRLSRGTCSRRDCIRQGKAKGRYQDPGLLVRIEQLREAIGVSGEGDS